MQYKTIVIGSGPGGYTAAIRLAQLGAKVAIIERDLIGGICTNWGCTPSKAMITSAKYAKYAKQSAHYGVNVGEPVVDFSRVAERRDEVMKKSREEIRHLLDYWKVDIFQGTGDVIDANHVKISPYDNPHKDLTQVNGESPYADHTSVTEETTLETEHIILATGSEPLVPGFLNKPDLSIVNSNKLIWIKDLPKELTIVGGGIIGLEFSALFSHFGTKVRIIELLDRCVSMMDPEISAEIERDLKEQGIEILTGHKVMDITNGKLSLEVSATGEKKEIESPMNLIAIGRKAIINNPMLEKLGIEFSPKGITVNTFMQTKIENIYAIGDATGLSILAHVAIQQGIIAAENIMGAKREMNYDVIPAVVYTIPEVATVGKVPEDLSGIKVVKFPFTANLRANIEEHNSGFVKLWINESSKYLIAAEMIGDLAGEIIQGYANIIHNKVSIEDIANTIHAHPTYNEIVRNSFEYALGRAIEFI
ncbi:MAG: dihydrolipoyl dehydrogenase [Candidatus Dojkabacteria bacterium]